MIMRPAALDTEFARRLQKNKRFGVRVEPQPNGRFSGSNPSLGGVLDEQEGLRRPFICFRGHSPVTTGFGLAMSLFEMLVQKRTDLLVQVSGFWGVR